ncbi:MAG: hypothetical protein RLZZ127_2533 [Planctomycetota bacterium]|jgi:AraC-like DNA-binding protein
MRSSDPPLRAPQVRLLGGAATVIDRRWSYVLRSAHWRLYQDADPGAWIDHPGGRTDLAPGRIVLVPPWGDFRSGCRGEVRHFFLHLDIPALEGAWHGGLLDRPQVLAPDPALAVLAARAPGDHWWSTALAAAALARWAADLPAVPGRALAEHLAGADPLAPALRLVDERLDQPLPVALLARACAVSEDTLGRMFRVRLGRSPAAWIRQRRCARAADLLVAGDEPVDTVAVRCGFANRHHFSRVFAQVMGTPPAAHRRAARQSAGPV